MQQGDRVTIPYPLDSFFHHILPPLRGGETGLYVCPHNNGIGEVVHEVRINDYYYLLREGEFTKSEDKDNGQTH